MFRKRKSAVRSYPKKSGSRIEVEMGVELGEVGLKIAWLGCIGKKISPLLGLGGRR